MSRFDKTGLFALLVLPMVLGGCRPQRGTANPEDYFPLIQVALAGGETAAMIGRNEALKAKSFEGCVAAASLITAFDSSAQVLAGKLQDQIVIPAVDIDVSECLALRESADVSDSDEETASLHGPVVVTMVVAGYAPATDDGPEEAAPEEAAPEEAAPEEAAPEEATPEEATPEEAAEAMASLSGHPDAAMLVETLGGITIAAVLHYAARLQVANCRRGTAAIGAIHYVGGMIKPIADELADPDGKVSVPAVAIDLGECVGD